MCSLSLDQQTFKHLYFDFCFENIIIIINNIESILYKNSINSRFMLDYLKSIINSYKKIIKLNKMFFIDKFGIKYYNDFSKKKIIFVVNDDNLKNNPSKEKMLELGYPKELCDIIEEFGELKFDNNILLYNKRSDENEYKFKSL